MHMSANWKVAMSMLVAVCLLMTQIEPAALAQTPPSSPPASAPATANPAPQEPAKPKSRFRRLISSKWILVGAAAVGGAAAVILIKNRKPKEPVVTVGVPTIGIPQ